MRVEENTEKQITACLREKLLLKFTDKDGKN